MVAITHEAHRWRGECQGRAAAGPELVGAADGLAPGGPVVGDPGDPMRASGGE